MIHAKQQQPLDDGNDINNNSNISYDNNYHNAYNNNNKDNDLNDNDNSNNNSDNNLTSSPGAKMGTWKCLRVQGFMIDPESIGVLKEIKLGCHDGNLGELFLFA